MTAIRIRLARLAAMPALHCLVLGGALWVAHRAVEEPPPVVVTAADRVARRDALAWQNGRAPDDGALDAELVEEALWYRAAVDLGLDRGEAIERRLRALATFVGEDSGDEERLARIAAASGQGREDVVIRRHLVLLARLAAGRLDRHHLPTEAELAGWLDDRRARFATPARITITHAYLAGNRSETAARALHERIDREGLAPREAAALGDAFIRGSRLVASRAGLEAAFGGGFADAVWDQEVGTWSRPVSSSYGLHLVWVEERMAAGVPAIARVRSRVLHEVLRERGERQRAARLQALRQRYDVRIEASDPPRSTPVS